MGTRPAKRSAHTIRRSTGNDHIVIVGAGIIGVSIAYHLAKRGAAVTLLEKLHPGAGATEKSFAWLNSFSKRPRPYYDLNRTGIAAWRRLSLEIPDLKVQWGGGVHWAARDGAVGFRRSVARLQKWGYQVNRIEKEQIKCLLPGFLPGRVDAACFAELEGAVDPEQALAAILRGARDMGVQIQYPCEVTAITTNRGRRPSLDTTCGKLEADSLVLAAGVDTPRLARLVGAIVPLKKSIGILAYTTPAARMMDRVALAPGATIKQNPDGRIVTGIDYEGGRSTDLTELQGERLIKNASRFLPGIAQTTLDAVTLGKRVMPKDGYPIVGFMKKCPSVYVAVMHSGVTLAPLIGELAATEILDGANSNLLKDYRLSRF